LNEATRTLVPVIREVRLHQSEAIA
jgi:hypothetical protein